MKMFFVSYIVCVSVSQELCNFANIIEKLINLDVRDRLLCIVVSSPNCGGVSGVSVEEYYGMNNIFFLYEIDFFKWLIVDKVLKISLQDWTENYLLTILSSMIHSQRNFPS